MTVTRDDQHPSSVDDSKQDKLIWVLSTDKCIMKVEVSQGKAKRFAKTRLMDVISTCLSAKDVDMTWQRNGVDRNIGTT